MWTASGCHAGSEEKVVVKKGRINTKADAAVRFTGNDLIDAVAYCALDADVADTGCWALNCFHCV